MSAQGTHDAQGPEAIRQAVENAVAHYQLRRFVETVVNAEISLAVAVALAQEDTNA